MMANKTYDDKNGTYYNFSTTYSDSMSPSPVRDTNETVGASMEQEHAQPLTVLEILKKILANEEDLLESFRKQMPWLNFRDAGSNMIFGKNVATINSKNWNLACDEMEKSGVLLVNLTVSDPTSRTETIDRPALKRLIDSMEQEQQEPVSDREVFAMLSALQLYQKQLRSQPCSEPGWQRMKGIDGLITMNIDCSASNLFAWNNAFKLFCHDRRFSGGTNWDVWDLDLELLDDIIGSFSRSMSEPSVKVGEVLTSDKIETVSQETPANYYPSDEGMEIRDTCLNCDEPQVETNQHMKNESVTAEIETLQEQLDDIFKKSIHSGPLPHVAAICRISPMIGEYADFGLEIAKPLTHLITQAHTAGKNPIRYASWMTCSNLVAQAKALVRSYTPRPDACTASEYQSALEKLNEVSK